MLYIDTPQNEIDLDEVLSNKEFFQLQHHNAKPHISSYQDLIPGPHQLFVKYFINPNNKNTRLICKHGTGTGKTLAALITGIQFLELNQFNESLENSDFNKIIVLGFTQRQFIANILKYPDLGFFTHAFKNKFEYLLVNAVTSEQQQELTNMKSNIQKTLKNKTRNVVFYGYRELYLALFTGKTMDNIWENTLSNYEKLKNGLTDKTISVNLDIIKTFNNAFIICDEIQELYNSIEINNYGLSIRFISNYYETPEDYKEIISLDSTDIKPLRFLFLSATLLSTSPLEIIDLINLVVPLKNLPNKEFIKKTDLFSETNKLLPSASTLVKSLLKGYVSYFIETSENYPTWEFKGVNIKNIDYVKFYRCPMTPIHYKTYEDVNLTSININDISLLDGVIPSINNKDHGIYTNKELLLSIEENTTKYNSQYGIYLNAQGTITGSFMEYNTISKYSNKYKQLLDLIFDNLKNNRGKIIVIHQFIKYWGVLFISELLSQNGILNIHDTPTKSTLCSICGETQGSHNNTTIQHYQPAKFACVHSDLKKASFEENINYFSSNNINGYKCRILIGSSIIKQSYHFANVREMILLSPPISYSDLMQIKGRAVRNLSHNELPPDKRHVNIYVLVSSVPGLDKLSLEENRYQEKSDAYRIIQEIDKIIHETAVDNYLFHEYVSDIEGFSAKPFSKVNLKLSMKSEVFSAFYQIDEVNLITFIIKQLFIIHDVWKIDKLWQTILDPPFYTSVDPKYFSKNSFIIALDSLSCHKLTIFDTHKMIYKNGMYNYLTFTGEYIILTQFIYIKQQTKIAYRDIVISDIIDYEPWNIYNNVLYDVSTYNLQNFLQLNNSQQMSKLEDEFMSKYENEHYLEMPTSFEYFTVSFHHYFIQNLILFFIDLYTNPRNITDKHKFAFMSKCLLFYSKIDLIMFADGLRDAEEYNIFDKYIYRADKTFNYYGIYLSSKIEGDEIQFAKEKKNPDFKMPVGHFLNISNTRTNYPTIYNIDTKSWKPLYTLTSGMKIINEVENDIIIGYYQVSSSSLEMKFKIRTPLHKVVKSSDNRLNEKGAMCYTKSKEILKSIAASLNLDVDVDKNKYVCEIIKNNLIERELNSRDDYYNSKEVTKKKLRWFYFPFDSNAGNN